LANSSYCQACSGLSPPSYRPCRAHKKHQKRIFFFGAFLFEVKIFVLINFFNLPKLTFFLAATILFSRVTFDNLL
ncbi:hypothetical protein WN865_10680, partial [Tetragenococcus halophilus]